MNFPSRLATATVALALATVPAPAYYYFLHYLSGIGVPEKFDLAALPAKTVTFFVSDSGPAAYTATDSFGSVLGQVQQAASVWNNVSTSDLRVAFGGVENLATAQNTPGGDVVFEDLPPGLLGYGGPTSTANLVSANGTFLPVKRSAIHLNRNLAISPGPSFNETFFMTLVHEMGHALGLQHTFTSSTMSTAITRATTVLRPLDADDIAGISALYPGAGFGQLGSINGRITAGGSGVHMASVVAIKPGFGAVSALTARDGSYRIDGVPPGQYSVYAHPLPPDADIRGPWNPDGSLAPASNPTNALFYPGTTDSTRAAPVVVATGRSTDNINIGLTTRSVVSIYDASVYSFLNGTIAVKPAYVDSLDGDVSLVAAGAGLGANGQAPGLNVQLSDGPAKLRDGGVRPYLSGGYTYIALDLTFAKAPAVGAQHVYFSTPDFLHVLPAGIVTTQSHPPTVTRVSASPDGTVAVAGTNWASDSKIYFDSLPASINAIDPVRGTANVVAPVGASGQTAAVSVFNSDGQSSQLVQNPTAVTFSYSTSTSPQLIALIPSVLAAGSEALLDLTTVGFSPSQAPPIIGFGSSDITVRKVFVLSANHFQVNVSVAPGAAIGSTDVSIISGFQSATAVLVFQIAPAVVNQPAVVPVLTNATPGLVGVYPTSLAFVQGTNLSSNGALPSVTIGNVTAPVLFASPTQLIVQIPSTLPPGTAVLSLNNGAVSAPSVLVTIDPSPALILSLASGPDSPIDTAHPAKVGDTVTVSLGNFATGSVTVAPSRVQVTVGGLQHPVTQVTSQNGIYQVSFVISPSDATGNSLPLIVYLDGRSSFPAAILVSRADGNPFSTGIVPGF